MNIDSNIPIGVPALRLASMLADLQPTAPTGRWTFWMEPTGIVLAAIALVLLCVVAWGSNLIALPGNWFSVALLAIYAWLGPQESRASIGYVAVIAAFVVALLGELVEFIAAACGAQRAGASRKSTLYAVLGSIAGAIGGALVGGRHIKTAVGDQCARVPKWASFA